MTSESPLILGTRGSDLALTQANMVRDALAEKGLACEIRIIKTIGDKRPDLKLSEFNTSGIEVHDKGIFTRELEEALLAGEIDFAVHSLKDVPTELAAPFEICATLPRAPITDVLLTSDPNLAAQCREYINSVYTVHSKNESNPLTGKTIATSSVRRAAQLRWIFPGVNIEDNRGNVPTRIRKMIESSDWNATILARAGMERLGLWRSGQTDFGFENHTVHAVELPVRVMHPAASQGAVAMEIKSENLRAREALQTINHPATFQRICAERSFLHALQAGCQTPVGIWSEFSEDGSSLEVETVVFDENDLNREPVLVGASVPVGQIENTGTILRHKLHSN